MNNKYKILVVEDEENIRTFVAALLEAGGYQVVQASTWERSCLRFFLLRVQESIRHILQKLIICSVDIFEDLG